MRLRTTLFPILAASFLAAATAHATIPEPTHREILVLEQSRNAGDPRLAELTRHDDPEVRARALRAAGRLQDLSLLDTLRGALADPDPAVRSEAVFALGQLFDPAVETILWTALASETRPGIREGILEAIGKSGSEESVSPLAEIVTGDSPAEAYRAAVALGVIAQRGYDITGARAAIDHGLAGRDPELRWRCGFAALRGRLPVVNGLHRSLQRQDPLTLIYAARTIAALKWENLGEKLLPLLEHEDWRVRVEAIRGMVETKQGFHSSQVALLIEDPNPNVRLTAIEALGRMDGSARVMHLDETSDWRVYAAYLKSISHAGASSLKTLRDAMENPDWRVRRAVAEALGVQTTEPALYVLEMMVHDSSPLVLTAVVNSLVSFPQRYAVEVIRGFLDSSDPAILTTAASAAGQRYDLSAVPLLVTAYDRLQSPVDTETMVAILDALGSILSATEENDPIGEVADGDRARAAALLESARYDPDSNVSASAARALSLVRDELVEPATPPIHEVPPTFDLDLALGLERDGARPVARITTSVGTVALRLFPAEAPGTVANFITLVREGYYNGLTFHRVVADFVVQGGDPRGDGWGGPGYAIRCEINPLRYDRGRVGMALSGKDTGGSQFFITHSPQPHLDGGYTIFGEVIDGMDVVDRIQIGEVIQEITLEGI